MKKIWKLTIAAAMALLLLTGCAAPAPQPERPPLQLQEEPAHPVAPPLPTDQTQQPSQSAPPPPPDDAPIFQAQVETTTEPVPPTDPANRTEPVQPTDPTNPVQPETPPPVPPQQAEVTDTRLVCSLEIRCDKLVGNAELDPDKVELIPQDGVLFAAQDIEFFEGESVFNVLQRALKQNKQHLEFAQSPLYNSAYIEGICNLYAYDCGALSGWMYRVNDWYPNYGCSQYALQNGDAIIWDYTCDLGADLGVEDATGNNQ